MSLVSTYCKCSDGNWYQDPIWSGENWFLCLDDDDPPELVIQVENFGLPKLPWFHPETKVEACGSRLYKGKFVQSLNQFGRLTKIPPPPQSHSGKTEIRPDVQGVFCNMEAK